MFPLFSGSIPNPMDGDERKVLPPRTPKNIEEPSSGSSMAKGNTDSASKVDKDKKAPKCPIHGEEVNQCCRLPVVRQIRFVSDSETVKVKN